MNIKKHIPNFLTCCNLLCGCLGIIAIFQFAFSQDPYYALKNASYLIFLACIFDFLDGFAARLLKVTSPIGKELDSLADCVTFGVLPGLIIYQLIYMNIDYSKPIIPGWHVTIITPVGFISEYLLKFIALLIPVFSALRLAKFNIDERQTSGFIGVPTPTNAILIASFPMILSQGKFPALNNIIAHPFFLVCFTLMMCYLLVAELPLFALKFKSFKWADNKVRFSFLGISLLLFIFLTWTAIPLIIFLYIILSVVENKLLKPKNN
ncbi:MAG: CDP-alcohol phosphatidyltransferase family protein [Cytophagaceae bacterium]|nr:CDP-alcohol phosphatidyltransferase family protein [Cytophagaceae bacterium]